MKRDFVSATVFVSGEPGKSFLQKLRGPLASRQPFLRELRGKERTGILYELRCETGTGCCVLRRVRKQGVKR